MIKTLVAQVVCLFGCFFAIAQNDAVDLKEVTVTDSRFERPASKKSRSVTLLTTIDIEPYIGSTLAALLDDQVGIHINGSNTHPGSELSYFIRGGNNRQVLFLVDGVPVNDPTQIENDFDLRTMDISTIESIEIIRGAASSLYGSAAATAVIKITTKRLNTQGLHGSIRTIFGTNNNQKIFSAAPNHQNRQLQLSLGNEYNAGSISLLDQRTLGMSSIIGDENDSTKKQNLGLRYQLQLLPQFSVNAFFNQSYFSSQYDDSFPSLMDADNTFISHSQRIIIQPKWIGSSSSFNGRVSWSSNSRDFDSLFPMYYEGDVTDIEGVFSTNLSPQLKGLVGVNYKKQEAKFSDTVSMDFMDYFVNVFYDSNSRLEAQAGARLSGHSTYGSHLTYHFNPSFNFALNSFDLRFYANLSTAFIAPSLYKLFDLYAGNEALQPETNQSFEIGGSVLLKNDGQIQFAYFNRDHKNFVAYDLSSYRYVNDARDFSVYGLEFLLEYPFSDRLRLQTNYAYTQHEEGEGLRIPKHKMNTNLRYDVKAKTQLLANIQFVGDRDDLAGKGLVELSSYWLFDFRVSHQLSQSGMSLFGSIENMFNADYEEVSGYTTRGRNLSIGVSYVF